MEKGKIDTEISIENKTFKPELIKPKYIFYKDDGIKMLITGLKLLNLIPASGFGETRITFQDGILQDTITTSERVRIKEKIDK